MTIYFRGGELQQKGKGIGGFFRGLINLFRPIMKSAGQSVVRAATSTTAKSIAKKLGEQALDSGLNITKDVLYGNDLKQSIDREKQNFKRSGGNIIDEIHSSVKRKRKLNTRKTIKKSSPNKRKVTLNTMKKYESRPY